MAEKKSSVEATVKNIRQKSRKKYSAEEKIRIVLEGLRGGRRPSLNYAVMRGSTKTHTTSGRKNFWKRANNVCQGTLPDKRVAIRSKTYGKNWTR